MKLKDGYVLRQVADNWVILPIGRNTVDFNGMLNLNNCGALLWKELERGADQEDLVRFLTEKYQVSPEEARADVQAYLSSLSEAGCVEME